MTLAEVLEPLNRAAFTLWGTKVSWAELFGDVTGLACVWLVARQSVWNWPIGILNNAFFAVMFFEAKLYAESALQDAFAALGVYGWISWTLGAGQAPAVTVRRTTRIEWLAFGAITVLLTAAVAWLLKTQTDSPAPVRDALILVASLVATYGQARKLLESWWIWIAIDLVSIPLYISRGLYPTAALYAVFLILCVSGLREWKRA